MSDPSKLTMGRKLVDRAQKARGRTPLKFEFEVIPFFAGELPVAAQKVAFVWERGTKVFQTEPEPVNPHTKAVFWKQFLRQTATVYQEGGRFLPKEYTFKIQTVKGSAGREERKTLAKLRVDLAAFCTEEMTPVPQEVFFQLKPLGKLKVSIKAAWMKDAKVDLDGLTEASFTTGGDHLSVVDDEQDLTGFEEHAAASARTGATSTSTTPGSPIRRMPGKQPGAMELPHERPQAGGSPRIPAAGPRLPGAIPGGFPTPLSPEDEARLAAEAKAAEVMRREQDMCQMRSTLEEQLRAELAAQLEAQRGGAWRDLFCCCLPRRQVKIRTNLEMAAADDGKGLLAAAAAGDAQ